MAFVIIDAAAQTDGYLSTREIVSPEALPAVSVMHLRFWNCTAVP